MNSFLKKLKQFFCFHKWNQKSETWNSKELNKEITENYQQCQKCKKEKNGR